MPLARISMAPAGPQAVGEGHVPDSLPIWASLVATLGLVALALEAGVRVKAAAGTMGLGDATRRSEALHDKLWAVAEEVATKDVGGRAGGLFIQSLGDVIDLHLKRVTTGIRSHIPATIWATLYLLMGVGMAMMGMQVGLSGARHRGMEELQARLNTRSTP